MDYDHVIHPWAKIVTNREEETLDVMVFDKEHGWCEVHRATIVDEPAVEAEHLAESYKSVVEASEKLAAFGIVRR